MERLEGPLARPAEAEPALLPTHYDSALVPFTAIPANPEETPPIDLDQTYTTISTMLAKALHLGKTCLTGPYQAVVAGWRRLWTSREDPIVARMEKCLATIEACKGQLQEPLQQLGVVRRLYDGDRAYADAFDRLERRYREAHPFLEFDNPMNIPSEPERDDFLGTDRSTQEITAEEARLLRRLLQVRRAVHRFGEIIKLDENLQRQTVEALERDLLARQREESSVVEEGVTMDGIVLRE